MTTPFDQNDAPNDAADGADTPLRFELMQASDYGRYFLQGRTEVLFHLRAMRQKGALISLYPGEGPRSFLTSLLSIEEDPDALIFDISRHDHDNDAAVASRRPVFITRVDKVRMQFTVPGLETVMHEGGPALKCAYPERLLRLQRRDYFRLTAPVNPRINCVLPLCDETGREQAIEIKLLDISAGGIAVLVPPLGISFVPDAVFHNVRMALPEVGEITTSLKVRNVFSITQRDGIAHLRAGCEFVDLAPKSAGLLQRFIMKLERERSLRVGR